MDDQKKIPVIAVVILVIVLFSAIGLFIFRKQSLVSPLPEGANVKVIFTSPPPTQTPVPTATPASSPVPTKKVTPTKKPAATPTVVKATSTPEPTVEPTETPTPTE